MTVQFGRFIFHRSGPMFHYVNCSWFVARGFVAALRVSVMYEIVTAGGKWEQKEREHLVSVL